MFHQTIPWVDKRLSPRAKALSQPAADDKLHIKGIQKKIIEQIYHYRSESAKALDRLKSIYYVVLVKTKEGYEFKEPKHLAFYRAYKGTNCKDIYFKVA